MKKSLCAILILFVTITFAKGQSKTDEEMIRVTVQNYFDGMMERDRSKLDEAFIPEARLIGFRGDQFTITPYEVWAEGTAQGDPRNKDDFKNELVAIRINGVAAVAETELYWPGIYYYDYLSLMKIDGQWKIVNKSWTSKPLD
ncbi:nuclear transport factor 2 family protein [Algoriphagus namhaensis]|uniref:Nuclear transport factor 2 family protein n=1 Tax=Algoriphagus namhaensis TaxID=915353 RepID=A0ABV8ALP7_9BACT